MQLFVDFFRFSECLGGFQGDKSYFARSFGSIGLGEETGIVGIV